MYESIPDNVMDEIVAGAGGQVENKAENAITFLNEWSGYIVAFIEIIKNFWNRISAIFAE